MLDEAIELAADGGAHEVVIGMAHRGRLNVLAHVDRQAVRDDPARVRGRADARGHQLRLGGRHRRREVPPRRAGQARRRRAARSTSRSRRTRATSRRWTPSSRDGRAPTRPTARRARASTIPSVALAILIHGDAAFPAQGVVAETLNLSYLDGYATGGTLHLISNNQVGFTTEPEEGRSTRYSSDLAKGFDAPIIHVNADDPEAAISAVRLALAFRRRFGNDVVIDLVGYRRHGHNEQDEPAFTQPLMAARILRHPPVREQFARAARGARHRHARGGRAARRRR